MPGYNVEGPAAAFSNTLEDYLTRQRREAMAQQELNQRMQEMSLRAQLEQQNLQMRQAELADRAKERDYRSFAEQTATMQPGDIPGADYVERARKLGFGHLVPAPTPQALEPGEQGPLPPQAVRFSGLPVQREAERTRALQEQMLQGLDPNSREYKALQYELVTNRNAPAGYFDRPGAMGSDYRAALMRKEAELKAAGQPPLTSEGELAFRKQWQEQGGEGRPYFIPLQTAEGILPYNARTGTVGERVADLKPGETAQAAIANAQSVAYQIGQLRDQFKPEFVGPLAGRYNSMQLALVGELGQEGLADFETAISRLGNTVIQLRTGAQMSQQEAERILKEVPGMNLPPDVFMARLQKADEYFRDWLKNRARQAYGRTTKEDVERMLNPPPVPKPGEKQPEKPKSPLDEPAVLPADWWQTHGGR